MPDFVSEVLNHPEAQEAPGADEGKASQAKHQKHSVGVFLQDQAPSYQGNA